MSDSNIGQMPLLLSKRQAAKLLGVGRGSTLERLIRAGDIRMVKAGARMRIPLEEVERFAREGSRQPMRAMKKTPRRRKESQGPDDDYGASHILSIKI